jgi:hypothetical protein
MRHLIEFTRAFISDLEVSPGQRLERLRVRKGTHAFVGIRPYVVETADGPVEMADLDLEDGTVIRSLPFEHFHFVE